MIYAIGLVLSPIVTKAAINQLRTPRLKAVYRWTLDLAVYLRTAIYERDGK